MTKDELIEKLIAEHTKIVLEALRINGVASNNVLPGSVFRYTEMFLKHLKDIVK